MSVVEIENPKFINRPTTTIEFRSFSFRRRPTVIVNVLATSFKALFVEFLGTLILIYFATLESQNGLNVLRAALTPSITLTILIFVFGHTSGCHVNPAVTVTLLMCGSISISKAILYIIVQCLGSIAGSGLFYLTVSYENYKSIHGSMIQTKNEPYQVLICETFVTTFFLFVILFSVANKNPKSSNGQPSKFCQISKYSPKPNAIKEIPNAPSTNNLEVQNSQDKVDDLNEIEEPKCVIPSHLKPVIIGLTLLLAILVGGSVSGPGINPFRVLGPSIVYAIVQQDWKVFQGQYVYYVSQIIASLISVLLFKYI